jgi:predicted dehydrogenase
MREVLGMPIRCIGAKLDYPVVSAILDYGTFAATYESGIDSIPRFDAHIEVYSPTKSVRIQYDTPYVKGLATTMIVEENVRGAYVKREVRIGYEDPYTLEMKELYHSVVSGSKPKTTAADAREDLDVIQMIVKAGHSCASSKD